MAPPAELAVPHLERGIGIDVATDAAWLVAIEGSPTPCVVDVALLAPLDLEHAVRFCRGAGAVAIDAPGGLSRLAHIGDSRVAPKFRAGRCSEVALARAGIGVPWITPDSQAALPSWMETGFALWQALSDDGHAPLETFPHAIFWRLAGTQLRHKQRPTGLLARLEVLGRNVTLPIGAAMWSHDGLDAMAASIVAWQSLQGLAECIDCRDDDAWPCHDDSAMWLPRSKT